MSLIVQNRVAPDDPLAVFIMGPTATGKTELAIALAQELPMDIISVDSAMVYRGMDIGSAKPDAATLERAPHRLIDICDPAEAYSAGRFRDDALVEMAEHAQIILMTCHRHTVELVNSRLANHQPVALA